ncbi:hypothetical protein B0H11DRAFT_1728982 [Mycena galericulata]|nr:hypothetical protein B0H11DRAFT_1728982 [Mycena galericulata]
MAPVSLRYRRRSGFVVAVLLILFFTLHTRLGYLVRRYYYYVRGDGPPTYAALRSWEAALPQHNWSLPAPEGKAGRYVKFSNQARWLGWNNCFSEVLMNAHLAYVSGRAYVFQDYYWAEEHYRWPREQWVGVHARTPLNAIVSGPVAGGPFEGDDPAPRAISQDWFDVVCPVRERRYINTRTVKPAVEQAPGIEVLTHWQKVLRDAPERCIEIIGAEEDPKYQTFDLDLWGSPRLLSLWISFSQSPISRLLGASSIVRAAIQRNLYQFVPRGPRPPHLTPYDPFHRMLAMHLRRGDFEQHCREMASRNTVFYGWSLFAYLPDRYLAEPDAPEHVERFLKRCWPDVVGVVEKAAQARRDYLAHVPGLGGEVGHPTLDVMYLLTNERSKWIDQLKIALRKDGWTVATSQDLVLDTEQTDVSMAVDMEIARRAEVFVGNGWSSFTSNIVYERLLDKRTPITIRFT